MTPKPQRLLILAADPRQFQELQLDEEMRRIREGLVSAKDWFDFRVLSAAKLKDIRRAMLDFRPTVVHFSGYGAGSEGLYLLDEDGQLTLVPNAALAELFALFSERLECVVLNACYSEAQAVELTRHIPYVVGMAAGITDAAAVEFSTAFYEALGAGESIDFSFSLASNALQLRGVDPDPQPVLLVRKRTRSGSNEARVEGGLRKFPEASTRQPQPLKVFLCHASENKAEARQLRKRLADDGFVPWLDETELLPGQDWDLEIRRALKQTDAVLVLLSKRAVNKVGYLQKEVRIALDIYREQPPGAVFLIPVRLEPCGIPDHLSHLQAADLAESRGYYNIVAALEKRREILEKAAVAA